MEIIPTKKRFFRCRCYYAKNIYVQSLNQRVDYYSRSQFLTDYRSAIERSPFDVEFVLKDAEQHGVHFRQENEQKSTERRRIVEALYRPLNGDVYTLTEHAFDERFLAMWQRAGQDGGGCGSGEHGPCGTDSTLTTVSVAKKVYFFPLFRTEFCRQLVDELEHFERDPSVPKGHANEVNETGILLDEMGFEDAFLTPLRERFVAPIAALLMPEWVGEELDSHRAFVAVNEPTKDRGLNFHFDNAEVTLNVSLGKEFTDGQLYVGPMRGTPTGSDRPLIVEHRPGWAVLHRGQQMHGVMPVTDGVRYNLIMWLRSSSVRNRLCPRCDQTPSLEPASGFGDGFTQANDPTSQQ